MRCATPRPAATASSSTSASRSRTAARWATYAPRWATSSGSTHLEVDKRGRGVSPSRVEKRARFTGVGRLGVPHMQLFAVRTVRAALVAALGFAAAAGAAHAAPTGLNAYSVKAQSGQAL